MKNIILVAVLILIFHCEKSKPETDIKDLRTVKECGDLLSQWAEKPNELEFLDCEPGEGQLIFKANYRVSGKQAHLVETFLRKKYGIGKLVFLCCGWDSKNGKIGIFKKPDLTNGIHYDISMYSEETLIKDRNQWNKIPYFYVTAKVLDI